MNVSYCKIERICPFGPTSFGPTPFGPTPFGPTPFGILKTPHPYQIHSHLWFSSPVHIH